MEGMLSYKCSFVLVFLRFLLLVSSLVSFSSAASLSLSMQEYHTEKPISPVARSLGSTPHILTTSKKPEATSVTPLSDGSVKVMYNHCPQLHEEEGAGSTTDWPVVLACEVRIGHFSSTGVPLSPEVVFRGGDKFPGMRGFAMWAHSAEDGEGFADTTIVGIWTNRCASEEEVCVCNSSNGGSCSVTYDKDTYGGSGCDGKWQGYPNMRYCMPGRASQEDWLVHNKKYDNYYSGDGWSCGREGTGGGVEGVLVAPLNSGVKIGKTYIVKLDNKGEIVWDVLGHGFVYDFTEDAATIRGGRVRTRNADQEVAWQWEYAVFHPTSVYDLCELHWGCDGYRISASGQHLMIESPPPTTFRRSHTCSHCAGTTVRQHPESSEWLFVCGSDSYPTVGINVNSYNMVGAGDRVTINTGQDNTHRAVAPAIAPVVTADSSATIDSCGSGPECMEENTAGTDKWLVAYRWVGGALSSDPPAVVIQEWEQSRETGASGQAGRNVTVVQEEGGSNDIGDTIGGDIQFERIGQEEGLYLVGYSRGDRVYVQLFDKSTIQVDNKVNEGISSAVSSDSPSSTLPASLLQLRRRSLSIGRLLSSSSSTLPSSALLDLTDFAQLPSQSGGGWFRHVNGDVGWLMVSTVEADEARPNSPAVFVRGRSAQSYDGNSTVIRGVRVRVDEKCGGAWRNVEGIASTEGDGDADDIRDVWSSSDSRSGGGWCSSECVMTRVWASSGGADIQPSSCPFVSGKSRWVEPCFGGECRNLAQLPAVIADGDVENEDGGVWSGSDGGVRVWVYDQQEGKSGGLVTDGDLDTYIYSSNYNSYGHESHILVDMGRDVVVRNVVVARHKKFVLMFPVVVYLMDENKTILKEQVYDQPTWGGVRVGKQPIENNAAGAVDGDEEAGEMKFINGYFWSGFAVRGVRYIGVKAGTKGYWDRLLIAELIVSGEEADEMVDGGECDGDGACRNGKDDGRASGSSGEGEGGLAVNLISRMLEVDDDAEVIASEIANETVNSSYEMLHRGQQDASSYSNVYKTLLHNFGFMKRGRQFMKQPSSSSSPTFPRSIDCSGFWSDWSVCNRECMQYRSFVVTREPQNSSSNVVGSLPCPQMEARGCPTRFQNAGEELEMRAKEEKGGKRKGSGFCLSPYSEKQLLSSSDCKGEYTRWSSCQNCVQYRRFSVHTEARGIGRECPPRLQANINCCDKEIEPEEKTDEEGLVDVGGFYDVRR
eukprot:GHVS01094931.1.p1 GENE.GHVS01094931.1~~GHVS01094931.1.p1  ORF type:complete len:1218 (-),score=231.30 GHVS01094931.1:304-3957(-)